MTTKEFKKQLQELKNTDKLHKHVINDILEDSKQYSGTYIEQIKSRCEDVAYGCSTGIVGSLLYYTDTTKFFEKYKEEINEILKEIQENCGNETIIKIFDGDYLITETTTKNTLVWLGYEQVNYKLLNLIEKFEEI